MAIKTFKAILVALFLLTAVVLTGCQKSYAPAPQATPTLVANGEFTTPLPTDMNDLMMIGELTATAAAQQITAVPAVTLPAATNTPAEVPTTPEENSATEAPAPTSTSTLPVMATHTPTPLPPTAAVTPSATPVPPATIPSGGATIYELQKGEYPYCIARRFNLNPDELLALNGLTPDQGHIYYPGFQLQLPQTGNPFPTERAWHPHPDTYTVTSADETIYGVACYYGDIDPMRIAQANNLVAPYTLQPGQVLQIP